VNFVHNFRPFAAPSKCRPHPRIALATAPSNHGAGGGEIYRANDANALPTFELWHKCLCLASPTFTHSSVRKLS